MKYVYPAVFEPAEEGGYIVTVPDVPHCYTSGKDMAQAIEMAQDAAAMLLVDFEDEGSQIPEPSNLDDLQTTSIKSLVLVDTDSWRKEFDSRAVKKTLTIPSWLNTKAERAGVNFSQLLRDALMSVV
ncbi:MAG: type II toxin-antitoxin system HicB family antitoxin [Spirochaetales bacterium]|nr:type II toxin-antitoxin system HicB family antitoxin [Spirochaetales bacterium]MBR1582263.1 type II toxin-antitoxin system HicB family antitoxin [Spirochaetales bacterium]